MNLFGYLLQKGSEGVQRERAFFGIGFNNNGVPIDVTGLHLIGRLFEDFSFLLTDTFPALNGENPKDISIGLKRMEEALERLGRVFGPVPLLLCSDFFDSSEYKQLFEETKSRVLKNPILRYETLQTIPQRFRGRDNAIDFPVHEYTCVGFLNKTHHFRVKVGQNRERLYDEVIKDLFPDTTFAYTRKSYDLSTPPKEVTPYTAKPDEIRIMLSDTEDEAIRKMNSAGPQALRYLATIGALAGAVLGRSYVEPKSIVGIQSDRLRDVARRMVVENILHPYQCATIKYMSSPLAEFLRLGGRLWG